MLGPLPKVYRVLVAVTALLVFVGGGAWAAYTIPYPILISAGAGVGLAVGAAAAYLLLHSSGPKASPERARRHRLH
ncbi:MAG TPA: hypothetical protein VFR87_19985 [Nocardioidaceae bacterium]|nr:hypothetical protein [Nocardioidaceae bacterium]